MTGPKSAKQQAAEDKLQDLAKHVAKEVPGMGFGIFVFEHHRTDGHIGWVSNGTRADMARALAEFLEKWKAEMSDHFLPLTLEGFEEWLKRMPAVRMEAKLALDFVKAYKTVSNQ